MGGGGGGAHGLRALHPQLDDLHRVRRHDLHDARQRAVVHHGQLADAVLLHLRHGGGDRVGALRAVHTAPRQAQQQVAHGLGRPVALGEAIVLHPALVHELGHVVGRHSLRQVFQDAGIAVLSFLIIGEATDVLQEALNVLPAALMHNAYSREFEREADDYAIKLLREAGIPSKRLGDALHRLTEQHGGDEGIKYFSSHPPTKERIEKTKEADK